MDGEYLDDDGYCDFDYYDCDDDYHGGDCDCEECEQERAEDECGRLPAHLGGGCRLAGTEHCDFDCPFRNHSPYEDDED